MTGRRELQSGTVLVLVREHEPALDDGRLLGLLDWSPEELDQIAKFRHQGAKTSWCMSRRLFDEALHELTGMEDARAHLEYGEQGKPFIRNCRLEFNWSHTDGCVALALAKGRAVGVDIESCLRQRIDYLAIADAYFRKDEREWVGMADGEESWTRFLSLFVQKEAWLKRTGLGLSCPLAKAPADLALPPCLGFSRMLSMTGKNSTYYLAVDSPKDEEVQAYEYIVEWAEICPKECSLAGIDPTIQKMDKL